MRRMRSGKAMFSADRQVREQRVVLEHHADVALVRRQVGRELAVDPDLARRRLDEPGDHHQQRRLARARGPEQRHELALAHVELGIGERHDGAVGFRERDRLELRLGGHAGCRERDARRCARRRGEAARRATRRRPRPDQVSIQAVKRSSAFCRFCRPPFLLGEDDLREDVGRGRQLGAVRRDELVGVRVRRPVGEMLA